MLLGLALAAIPLSLTYLLALNLLLGIQAVRAYNRVELGSRLLGLALLSGLVLCGRTEPTWVFAATLVGAACNLAWALWTLSKHLDRFLTLS